MHHKHGLVVKILNYLLSRLCDILLKEDHCLHLTQEEVRNDDQLLTVFLIVVSGHHT